ncbi:MAG: hypothetical protein K0R59_483 [Sphingobacterium sp.]|jgi:hypothetical protein|nr:hypothetical protein [Sphingobacterium sp.]
MHSDHLAIQLGLLKTANQHMKYPCGENTKLV